MKKKIMTLSVSPLVLMGLAIIIFTMTLVQSRIEDDTESTLKSVAVAVSAAYGQNSGDYLETEDGDVWKGAYNISKSETLVDSIKEESGVDVTFCYGRRRVVTSAKDDSGQRIIGSEVGDSIASQVLDAGQTVFTKSVLVNNTEYYGYYMPVYQNGSEEVVGMIFAGLPVETGLVTYYSIWKVLAGVSLFFVVIYLMIGNFSAESITRAVKAAGNTVKAVAAGELAIEIEDKYLHRKDEIGELCKSVDKMKNELRFIIEDINDNTQKLLNSADALDGNAQSTLVTVGSVDKAVNEIADGATSQARDAVRASENVNIMGNMLAATDREIQNLNGNAKIMQDSSAQATQSLNELMRINQEVMEAIDLIYEQTSRTNASSQKIKEATNIISNISEETNLLSLNASIEAARAGEQGRGFAVVASEIQHLAEQSGASTDSINAMVSELICDSDKAVETMEYVREIFLSQSRNVEQTKEVVAEVIRAIEASSDAIESIERQSMKLNQAKDEIVQVVESLSAIAEENAASTEETSAATTEVANSFNEVTEAADSLKNIADSIADTMGTFKLV